MESAKLIIEVVAGLVPGTPMPEYTRRWGWSGADQEALNKGDKEAEEKYIRIAGESREYAASLEDPRRLNWVRRDWLWL
jgi:hypothetical protein